MKEFSIDKKAKLFDDMRTILSKMDENNILETVDMLCIVSGLKKESECEFFSNKWSGNFVKFPVKKGFNVRDKKLCIFGVCGTIEFLLEKAIREGFYKKDEFLPDESDISEFFNITCPFSWRIIDKLECNRLIKSERYTTINGDVRYKYTIGDYETVDDSYSGCYRDRFYGYGLYKSRTQQFRDMCKKWNSNIKRLKDESKQ